MNYESLFRCCRAIEDDRIEEFMYFHNLCARFGFPLSTFDGPFDITPTTLTVDDFSRAFNKLKYKKRIKHGQQWTTLNKCYG